VWLTTTPVAAYYTSVCRLAARFLYRKTVRILLDMAKTNNKRSKRSLGRKARDDDSQWAVTTKVQRPDSNKLTHFKTILTYPLGGLYIDVATTPFGANAITLSSLTNYSAFTSIFDSYKIDLVEYKFTLRNAGASGNYPTLVLYPDWDDATAPASVNVAQSHPRAVLHTFTPNRPMATMALVPRIAQAAYQGVFAGYSQPIGPTWVDSGSPSVAHYGIKWAAYNLGDSTQVIDVSVKAWVSFREPV
jgi:hypothetical protein